MIYIYRSAFLVEQKNKILQQEWLNHVFKFTMDSTISKTSRAPKILKFNSLNLDLRKYLAEFIKIFMISSEK